MYIYIFYFVYMIKYIVLRPENSQVFFFFLYIKHFEKLLQNIEISQYFD